MKRLFDVSMATIGLVILAVPMAIIALMIKMTSPGPIIYWSDRIGIDNRVFRMPKFRTMRTGTPQLATHLLTDSRQWITGVGWLLRKTSLDELPQLWPILVGDMSFVGPRPALSNQDDLIDLRTQRGVHILVPGITGWAQINGRDELSIPEKVKCDQFYLHNQSLLLDLRILFMTFVKVVRRDGVRQADETQDVAVPRKAA